MDGAAVLSTLAQACPSLSGRQLSAAAGEYSKLAGLLAGFAFTGLVFILRERVSGRYARAVEVLVFAFFGLILSSANYAIITGEEEQYGAGRVVSEVVFAAAAFTVSGVLLLYALILLLDAVDESADRPVGVDAGEDSPADGPLVDTESPFGRVKRHLSVITAVFVTFVLLFMVAPGSRTYADVTDRASIEVVGAAVLVAQLVISAVIGITYLIRQKRDAGALAKDWTGASRFGVVSVGFVLVNTVACQWAGNIAPCDQVNWLLIAGAVALHGAMMGYASVVIGRPWLTRPSSMPRA